MLEQGIAIDTTRAHKDDEAENDDTRVSSVSDKTPHDGIDGSTDKHENQRLHGSPKKEEAEKTQEDTQPQSLDPPHLAV
jgi:hypothetical protein